MTGQNIEPSFRDQRKLLAKMKVLAAAARERLDPLRSQLLEAWDHKPADVCKDWTQTHFAIHYDANLAPRVTLAKRLRCLEITPTSPLWLIVLGMAAWNIYIKDTDHLTDKQFAEELIGRLGDATPVLGKRCDEIMSMKRIGVSIPAQRLISSRDMLLPRSPRAPKKGKTICVIFN